MAVRRFCAACTAPKESSFQQPVALDGISSKYEIRTRGGQTATNPRDLKAAHSAYPPTGQYLGPGSRGETCIPDPLTLGWKKESGRLLPVLPSESSAPDCVLELVKCACGATKPSAPIKCTSRCSCKRHNLARIELCQCGEEDMCPSSLQKMMMLMTK